MKSFGLDYIDYWHDYHIGARWLKCSFGVRVQDGQCWAIAELGDGEVRTFGRAHKTPVDPQSLPDHLRFIVEEHRANDPTSDLPDVFAGRKSFQEAGVTRKSRRETNSSRNHVAFERFVVSLGECVR